ncbi:hypothetical protein [cf. Phormidesmis sp. LEGE 11477]|uniref:hypothetical protein n=1 Tax=cf. Phormidesmis sp. LEGE 11477 TaxID=1828680 RepID=UPI00187E8E88|nr:hypothetical protein [cf. Phormidesmis sp. LEGE 11477]MBE9062809.1 hypothetical protein [cf. Phormidesmis sp. LEGE 11477]
MSQQLTLEISDEVYADLQRQSSAVGVSTAEWILSLLSRQSRISNQSEAVDNTSLSPELQVQARSKFRSHAGAVSLGYATDTDNDQIDADLAKAYADDY